MILNGFTVNDSSNTAKPMTILNASGRRFEEAGGMEACSIHPPPATVVSEN